MLNHADTEQVNCKFFYEPKRGLTVQCLRDIAISEQLFISYDNRPDDELLLDYGFALGVGENTKTYLLFSLNDVNELATSCFYMNPVLVEQAKNNFIFGIQESLLKTVINQDNQSQK